MTWIHAVIDVPAELHAATAEFWGRAFDWPAGPSWPNYPELRSFEPPSGAPYLHLQQIAGPPGVHLDIESDDPDAMVARAVELGAEFVGADEHWETLRSPGGLRFCVLRSAIHEAPGPATFPDGHRARMVQACIDSPRDGQPTEVAFWRALLTGRWAPSDEAEFAGKWHDDAGSPLQLLMQQLDEASGPTRVHLDHGTDDLAAEVRRLVDLGATDLGPGDGWHVLRDVAGLPFCVTSNAPDQTRIRDIG